MITSDIVNSINDLEERFPVDQWTVNGIRVWPLYRIGLYFGYIRSHQSGTGANSPAGALLQRLSQAFGLLMGIPRYCVAEVTDRRKHASPSSLAEAVFLSDGISFANIDGAWYEKFCDPLMRRLTNQGKSSLLMSLSHNYLTPRHSPSVFLQPRLDCLKVRSRFLRHRPGPQAEHLPGHAALVAYAAQAGIASFLPSLATLRWQALQVRSIADLHKTFFLKIRPKIGFVVSYYGTEGMAFNLACRESGIPSVDIQHGVAGELCPPYGRWRRVPAGGYGLLPSVFWCWSEPDAAAIEQWSPGGRNGHTAVVGGNPWMSEWQRDDSDLVRNYDRVFASSFPSGERGDVQRILITLQTGFSTAEHLAPLLEAMRTASSSWLWLVRLHPCMLHEKYRIAALLHSHGITKFEINNATALPLFALLRHTDIHVTHSSATVVEAAAFGVPSVIISTYGAEFFQQQIADGWARTAYTADAVLMAIEGQNQDRENLRRLHRSPAADIGRALSFLTGMMDRRNGKG